MSPIRRTINYVVVPIILAITVAIMTTMIVLMSIDENKYVIEFLVLFGVIILIIAALLISVPFTRKKEVAIELEKYDFDVKSAEPRDEYVFTKKDIVATFPLSSSPFDDFKNEGAKFSGLAGLQELMDYYGLKDETAKLHKSFLEFPDFSVSDYTKDIRYTDFYAEARNAGELEIYGLHTIVINQNGLSVNDAQLGWEKAHAEIAVYNLLVQVHIYLNILFDDEELTLSLKLNKDVLSLIDKFSIKVENREILDFIVNNKRVAFEEILKRGRITEKTLNKYSR